MPYTPEQRRNIALAKRMTRGDAPRVRKALLEAGLVESSWRHLNYGDRSSMGVLQQRPDMGWGPYIPGARGVRQDISDFLQRARRVNKGFTGTPGQLAQAVQRSAFPERYDQRAKQAEDLLRSNIGGAVRGSKLGIGGSVQGGALGLAERLQPSQDAVGVSRNTMTAYLLQTSNELAAGRPVDPNSILNMAMLRQEMQPGQQATTVTDQSGKVSVPVIHGKLDKHTKNAVGLVKSAIGTPYVWGGESPGGFDCSGLLQWAWGKTGKRIPRVAADQFRAGSRVPRGALKPGDAVFFRGSRGSAGNPGHVGMYVGGGKFIEAPRTGLNVRISHLAGRSDYMGARRY